MLIIRKQNFNFGKGSTQRLNNSTLTAEVQYSVNFSRSNRNLCLSRRYNGSNNFLFVNATKIYQFKTIDSEKYSLFLGNISGDSSANKMKNYDFSVDYRAFNTSNIVIQKYLLKKHDMK